MIKLEKKKSSKIFLKEIKELFSEHRNNNNAVWMSKYMKNKFTFYGIKAPLRKKITKEYLAKTETLNCNQIEFTVLLLWKEKYRELHYFALDLIELTIQKDNKNVIYLFICRNISL